MIRDLGTVTTGLLEANVVDFSYFIRLDIPAPTGTVRFTTRHTSVTEDIDGSEQLWSVADVVVGNLDQGQQTTGSVSTLSFANLDYAWTVLANSPGLRDVDVQVWEGWFDADGDFVGSILRYEGQIDNQRCGERAEFALKPFRAFWRRRVVTQVPGISHLQPAPLMPDDNAIIYW